MQHPFFAGVEWSTLRSQRPPFVPELQGPTDTSYFDDFEDASHIAGNRSKVPSAFALATSFFRLCKHTESRMRLIVFPCVILPGKVL